MKKKSIVISLLVATLVGVGGAYYSLSYVSDKSKPASSNIDNQVNPSESTPNPDNTNSTEPRPTPIQDTKTEDKIINSSSPGAPSDITETPTITRAEQSGSFVRVSATLQQPSDGKCSLTLTKGSQTVEKNADIIVGPSYYACNGFRIPVGELSPGQWTATLSHVLNGQVSASEEKTIVIN